MTSEIKKWWNKMSEDYQKLCKIPVDVHYGPGSPDEKDLKLIGNVRRKKVLEIGCGGAQCSIAFAKQGAYVTAVDLSEKQLEFAQNLANIHDVKIKFYQRDIQNLKPIKSKNYDIVFSAFAIQYVKDLHKCFRDVKRVLKKNGLFVFSLDHPVYRIANPSTLKIKESYFDVGKTVYNSSKGKFVVYNRTVSELYNALVESGFFVEKIIEPDSRKRYPYDPWYGLWNYYIPKLMNMVPPTIIFKARKK